MMNLGSWALPAVAIEWIKENFDHGSTILELGSGKGTGVLAKDFKMFSVEHDQAFVGKHNSKYIHAPIVGGWYDAEIIKARIPSIDYDLLIVDGPPRIIGREGMLFYLDLFRTDRPAIVDDAQTCLPVMDNLARHLNAVPDIRQCDVYTYRKFAILLPESREG